LEHQKCVRWSFIYALSSGERGILNHLYEGSDQILNLGLWY
jgi:hypothetical protein